MYLFQSFKKRTDCSHQVHISYMEIYNEHGYDLLAEDLEGSHDVKKELPRVHLREDSDGNIHLRNLSAHPSGSEEEALNYLFVGDTNRHVSETTMNLESSRSHCIFTIFITASKIGSDTVRRSKIHLVDLAGSERVHKSQVSCTPFIAKAHTTRQIWHCPVSCSAPLIQKLTLLQATDRTLNEAKFINSSLHFLEMVIIALQERSRGKKSFVPYVSPFAHCLFVTLWQVPQQPDDECAAR